MSVTRGLDVLVYAGTDSNKKAIGGQKGCTLTMEADTIDIDVLLCFNALTILDTVFIKIKIS